MTSCKYGFQLKFLHVWLSLLLPPLLLCLQIRFWIHSHVKEKKRGTKKSTSGGNDTKEEAHGILEGISSLHSWIKTQTMIRPHQKGRGGKQGAMYDEVKSSTVNKMWTVSQITSEVNFLSQKFHFTRVVNCILNVSCRKECKMTAFDF